MDAHELSRLLAARIEDLCRTLLPAGRVLGSEWKLSGSQGGPIGVVLRGRKAGVWQDFSSGVAGDALDLVAARCCHGDIGEACAWARRWLGLESGSPAPIPIATRPAKSGPDEDEAKRRKAALAMWLHARPLAPGDAAVRYLAARGIDLAALGRAPRALRYAPSLWCEEARDYLPAMVAAVSDAAGEHIATHRTWLARRGDRVSKAHLQMPKKTLGRCTGGSIRLWRGASRKPLAEAEDGETVAIAEGIETALSVACACPELRVLCCISLGNMANLELPDAVETVLLCADNDAGNPPARRALARAVTRYESEGRAVRVAMPRVRGADWNDVMTRDATRSLAA